MPQDFIIQHGDELEVFIYPKKGYVLVESQIAGTVNASSQQMAINSLPYLVDQTGQANLPMLGWVQLEGLTEHSAEEKLEELYRAHYIDPYVNVRIKNKYLTVYRGSSDSKQVVLTSSTMTVMEAIGQAGGIPESGKSKNIKIIRKQNGVVQTEELDLSEIEGVAKGQYYVKPNDIIYIEPNINSQFFKEASPVLTAVSSLVVIYVFFINLSK
ncbi:MAG: polysaccharide biosynthesis/export family protein [Chitinophagales bacterium]